MTPLRQRMLEDMSIRNLADNTQLSYVQQVVCFARYFGRSPEELGPEEVRAYQSHLVNNRHLVASSVGTATAAVTRLAASAGIASSTMANTPARSSARASSINASTSSGRDA